MAQIPDTVATLIKSAQALMPTPDDIPITHRVGPSTVGERIKMRAFEKFVATQEPNLTEIAKELGCSKQYLYRIAKQEQWFERKTHMAVALRGDAEAERLLEFAKAQLEAKISTRLFELDELCRKKNLKAVIAWLQMAGVGKPQVEGKSLPSTTSVYNDLSDNRQVTVVQPGASAPALEE